MELYLKDLIFCLLLLTLAVKIHRIKKSQRKIQQRMDKIEQNLSDCTERVVAQEQKNEQIIPEIEKKQNVLQEEKIQIKETPEALIDEVLQEIFS